jgi:recombination protein RecA
LASKKTNKGTAPEATVSNDKLKLALKDLESKFGVGVVRRYGDSPTEIERTSSGILSLDQALGGGYPKGSMVEIYGPSMGGKTVIATYAGIEIQKTGKKFGPIDLENTYNPLLAAKNGMDIDDLFICNPETGEQAFAIAEALANCGEFGGLLFDSVAAAEPQLDAAAEMGAQSMGLQARMMSQCLRRINPVIARNKCTMFFINQVREKIGVMYGNPETTAGGRALAFYSSIRMDVRPSAYINAKGEEIKTREGAIGHLIKVKIVKNKYSPPFKEAEFVLIYGVGIDTDRDALGVAVDLGVVDKSGNWLSYGHIKENGEAKFVAAVREAGIVKEIKDKTYEAIVANSNSGGSSVDRISTDDPDEVTEED